MADADGAATPSNAADFFKHIDDIEFKILHRVAATKPLDQLFGLIGLTESSNNYNELRASQEADDSTVGVVHVYAVTRPRMFGLRLAVRMEDETHLIAVLGGAEYHWKEDLSYERSALEQFLATEVAPRVIIGVWTVMSEVARTVGADLPNTPPIPPDAIVMAVQHQFNEHPASPPDW